MSQRDVFGHRQVVGRLGQPDADAVAVADLVAGLGGLPLTSTLPASIAFWRTERLKPGKALTRYWSSRHAFHLALDGQVRDPRAGGQRRFDHVRGHGDTRFPPCKCAQLACGFARDRNSQSARRTKWLGFLGHLLVQLVVKVLELGLLTRVLEAP